MGRPFHGRVDGALRGARLRSRVVVGLVVLRDRTQHVARAERRGAASGAGGVRRARRRLLEREEGLGRGGHCPVQRVRREDRRRPADPRQGHVHGLRRAHRRHRRRHAEAARLLPRLQHRACRCSPTRGRERTAPTAGPSSRAPIRSCSRRSSSPCGSPMARALGWPAKQARLARHRGAREGRPVAGAPRGTPSGATSASATRTPAIRTPGSSRCSPRRTPARARRATSRPPTSRPPRPSSSSASPRAPSCTTAAPPASFTTRWSSTVRRTSPPRCSTRTSSSTRPATRSSPSRSSASTRAKAPRGRTTPS